MNIAILIPELGGGGAERVAQILGDYYVDCKNKVFYFLQDMNIKQDYPVKGKIIKTPIKSCMAEADLSDAQRMMHLIKSSVQMRKLKRQYKIDIAISFMEEFNYINVLSKGREKVITRICTILSERKELNGFLYRKKIVHFFYARADHVVVMSEYARNDMHSIYKVPQKKLTKIPNAVIGNRVERDDADWMYGFMTVICMGRLESVKQQDRIIRAFSYVAAHEKLARLIFLGKGPNLNYLRGLSKKLGIDEKVTFVGFTDQTRYYLSHARVFVMASKAEGFPNSMIEAMSCGVPVVTTDCPGACGEIVGKPKTMMHIDSILLCQYGILTPRMSNEARKAYIELSGEEEMLGKAMLQVLKDDELYEKYHIQSLKRARTYSLDKVIKKWNHLIYSK